MICPRGCRQLAPRALKLHCDPRHMCSVVRASLSGQYRGREGVVGPDGLRLDEEAVMTQVSHCHDHIRKNMLEANPSTAYRCPGNVRATLDSPPLCLPAAVH